MKLGRRILLLLTLAAASFAFLSMTFARYTTAVSGGDTALVARWNFSARGEDDPAGTFYTKGFTFDLFSAKSVSPMDSGHKSFTFTGGGSDTAIAYDVRMKASDLLLLTRGTVAGTENADIYAPFIFRITVSVSDGACDAPPVVFTPPGALGNGWFRPEDIAAAEDGFFSIFDKTAGAPGFSAASADQVTVTVFWQWNTSCYIGDTGAASVAPDVSAGAPGDYPPYYQAAYDAYYGPGGLEERRVAAANAVTDYLSAHGGGPSPDGTWQHEISCPLTPAQHDAALAALSPEGKENYLLAHNGTDDGTGSIAWGAHTVPCPHDHYAEYNALVAVENAATADCRTSLLRAYDDYDTLAADALGAKESVKVIFHITGVQLAPG
ncbi:hypothetical protein SAMN02745823_02220 [Sporobacter termitidis DSM 10068]|uniref:Uncharacterized protein n=1 Tax=Sporobacter termitidis DSM 10068 TaxID=1123282 RepID=A0A1M5Y4A9_9FIRM|nr:hypothetical protein [Sporobacter termitidis]SHI06945.1 hypothetical protein SAMN02745823_02220 [Sporobacter termitidis DSM 10068]